MLYVDPTGLKPGDSFKTLDEAAIDAGNYYLEKTYQNDEEMCGLFYQKADGTYTYQDVKNTSPNKKDAFYISWTKAPLAVIHTHVYRDVDDPNNQFSYPGWTSGDNGNSDTNFADSNNIPLYLATPIGELKLYTPNSGNTSGKVISDQLVVDPKYTAYNQIKNTLIWGLLDKQFPAIDKMDIVKAKVKHPDSLFEMLKELGVVK